MNASYKGESIAFERVFERYVDKRIVLYGIGRYTATLLSSTHKFNIVGLMDRDPENIGRIVYGLPVFSKEEAEKKADMIIINTSETYWKIIFARISDIKIPVFYLNGNRASLEKDSGVYSNNAYWDKNYNQMAAKVEAYGIVSFDVFDTLVMWKFFSPQDLYKLIELELRNNLNIVTNFYRLRTEIESTHRSENLMLDEIYVFMNERWGFCDEMLDKIKEVEISLTLDNVVPRKIMIEFCNELIASGDKKIYFVSDMYLPNKVMERILLKCGIVEVGRLWISGVKKKDKRSGAIWRDLMEENDGQKVLHIGDNNVSDIERAQEAGLDTYYIMSPFEMMMNSSLKSVAPRVIELDESVFIGLLCVELFNDPFALCEKKGRIYISKCEVLGYVVFGAVICSFLMWLIHKSNQKKIERLLFFLRDGYFLEKDYSYMCSILKRSNLPKGCLFAISRRLAMSASCESKEDFQALIEFPYQGFFHEYMMDRFNVAINPEDEHYNMEIALPSDSEKINIWLRKYREDIIANIEKERKRYKEYIDKFALSSSDAVVDLWFYGHNQFYLSKISKQNLTGFYFAANLSKENECNKNNILVPCFQKESDVSAKNCNLYGKSLWVESFLTAPYGMIKSLDEKGGFICSLNGRNQVKFEERELINAGVCRFIDQYISVFKGEMEYLNERFVDDVFGEMMRDGIEIDKDFNEIFYYDNSMIQRRDLPIFE